MVSATECSCSHSGVAGATDYATVPKVNVFARGGLGVCGGVGALMLAAPAGAVVPSVTAVVVRDRMPLVTFEAPKAGSATLFIASKGDRAADGSFIAKNVVVSARLPRSALQAGTWRYHARLDPGDYFLLLKASADATACAPAAPDGALDPSCAEGFSPVVSFTVPVPRIRYEVYAKPYLHGRIVRLGLLAEALGEPQTYKVCYHRLGLKGLRCVAGRLDGYSWNESTSDVLSVDGRSLAHSTTFTWFVDGTKVASRTTKTH
jgi:hypothetical protein